MRSINYALGKNEETKNNQKNFYIKIKPQHIKEWREVINRLFL
jgi:hypothetical protein